MSGVDKIGIDFVIDYEIVFKFASNVDPNLYFIIILPLPSRDHLQCLMVQYKFLTFSMSGPFKTFSPGMTTQERTQVLSRS